jgi:hypothetical protein
VTQINLNEREGAKPLSGGRSRSAALAVWDPQRWLCLTAPQTPHLRGAIEKNRIQDRRTASEEAARAAVPNQKRHFFDVFDHFQKKMKNRSFLCFFWFFETLMGQGFYETLYCGL